MNHSPTLQTADFTSLFDSATVALTRQAVAGQAKPTFWQAVFASWIAPHAQGQSVDY